MRAAAPRSSGRRGPPKTRSIVSAVSRLRFGVGHAGFLEVEDVEEVLAERVAPDLDRRTERTRHRGHAQPDHAADTVGVQEREVPGDHRAPVVADDHGAFGADVVEQSGEVAAQRDDVVVLDRLGPRRAAVAALIRGQHVVAGVRQCRNLMPPRVSELGETRAPAPPAGHRARRTRRRAAARHSSRLTARLR